MNTAYLLLGSNQGNREQYLLNAKAQLEKNGCYMTAISSRYQTAAWGMENQPNFLNQVIAIKTRLEPEELLQLILHIEKLYGRERTIKWGPRTLDIDILFFGDTIIQTPLLTIPHPGIAERRFTLLPLCELAPTFIHPILHKTMQQLLDECPDILPVQKLD